MDSEVCEFLDWDSEFFGRRIGRLASPELNEFIWREVQAWANAVEIDCLYVSINQQDSASVSIAEANDFHLVDIRVQLENRGIQGSRTEEVQPTNGLDISAAKPTDLPLLQNIAREAHRNTRFYNDTNFPAELCDEMYVVWITKSCDGSADAVFVARQNDSEVLGYITCKRTGEERTGEIGLLAVSESARRQGIGTNLIRRAVKWARDERLHSMSVVTQGGSVAAQRVYQENGFLTADVKLYYHKWFR